MSKIILSMQTLAQVTVTTAGTRVPLSATPLLVRQALIQWAPANAGNIYIGEADVVATKCIILNAANPGLTLEGEDTVADENSVYFDLGNVYIDAATSGDKVNIAYFDLDSRTY